MSPRAPLVVFAGGGSVGHLAPAFALETALARRGARALYVTPGEAVERGWFPPGAPEPVHLDAPRRPRTLLQALLFGPRMVRAVLRGAGLLRRRRARAVLALGGWPCVPAALAALLTGTRLALVTSDTTPGVVVRLLTPLAWRVYAAQASARTRLTRGLLRGRNERVLPTGPIVRPEVVEGRRDPAALGLAPARRTFFVFGGSLGAEGLNRAFVAGLCEAVRQDPALRERLQVLHSVGKSGAGVAEAYAAAGVPHRVLPYLREIGTAYRSADLVVARAGAITCAELEAVGAPAVLVPNPHHADRQQLKNAEPLAARGGALVIEERDLTPAAVRDVVLPLLFDPARLAVMSERVRVGYRDATSSVAADLLS